MAVYGACMAIIHASYTGTGRASNVPVRTVSTAQWSRNVANTLTDVVLVSRYIRYVGYMSVTLPPYRPSPRPSRPPPDSRPQTYMKFRNDEFQLTHVR